MSRLLLLLLCVDASQLDDFHARVGANDVQAARQDIAAGVDVNAEDRDHYTALHLAAGFGYTEMLSMLLEVGARVEGARGRSEGRAAASAPARGRRARAAQGGTH